MSKSIYRPTPTERARLGDYCVARRREGYAQSQIAKAVGLGGSTIVKYLNRAGEPRHQTSPWTTRDLPLLEPYDWRDKQPPRHQTGQVETVSPPEPYTVSSTISVLTTAMYQLRCDSARVRFAHDVNDAVIADDQDWLRHAASVVNDMTGYLAGLQRVLDDAAHRSRVIRNPEFRDEFATPMTLRAVR